MTQRIEDFKTRNWQRKFQFIPREISRVADHVAKNSFSKENEFSFIDATPSHLMALMESDCMGCQSPRDVMFLLSVGTCSLHL